jgi:ubiquinone biosynthesis protein UbiJ
MIQFLNAVITKLDEEAWRFLKPHENKIICFEIIDIRTLYFQIKPDGLESIQIADGTLIHTTFKGTLASFIKMGYSKQGVHNDLHIRGDLECAKALYDTWQYLECDWEGAFADLTHPTLAHGVFSGLKQGKEWLKQTYAHRSQDLSAYLQDEIQFLPTQAEVDELFKNIETCRDDVERLEAKIKLYIKNSKGL